MKPEEIAAMSGDEKSWTLEELGTESIVPPNGTTMLENPRIHAVIHYWCAELV